MADKPTGQPTGQPSLLNPRRVDAIIKAIEDGHFLETAAVLAGVSRSTYHGWKRRGENEIRRVSAIAGYDGQEIIDQFLDEERKLTTKQQFDTFADPVFDQKEWPYALFATLIARARAKFIDKTISNIQTIANDPNRPNWTALKWLLEKTQPEQYGDRKTITHEGNPLLPVQIDLPTPEQLAERLKQLKGEG